MTVTKRESAFGLFRQISSTSGLAVTNDSSGTDLQTAINRFVTETNDNPKPFIWSADPDAIIEKDTARETGVRVNPLVGSALLDGGTHLENESAAPE